MSNKDDNDKELYKNLIDLGLTTVKDLAHYFIDYPESVKEISDSFEKGVKKIGEFFQLKCSNCDHKFFPTNFNWNTFKWICPNCHKEVGLF